MERLDKIITLFINSLNSPFSDPVWKMFSNRWVWIPLYIAVLILIIKKLGWKKGAIVLLSIVLAVIACDYITNLIKYSVSRLRPSHDEWMIANGLHLLEGEGKMYGFPSAHTANSFGFASSSLMGLRNDKTTRYKGYAWLIYCWAALVGISRIFVGKHFLGDVLVGAVLGLVIGCIFGIIARKIVTSLES